jgi:hypothetical protein
MREEVSGSLILYRSDRRLMHLRFDRVLNVKFKYVYCRCGTRSLLNWSVFIAALKHVHSLSFSCLFSHRHLPCTKPHSTPARHSKVCESIIIPCAFCVAPFLEIHPQVRMGGGGGVVTFNLSMSITDLVWLTFVTSLYKVCWTISSFKGVPRQIYCVHVP